MALPEPRVPAWLQKYEPSGDALLRSLSAMVTDKILIAIANCDYGDGAKEHEAVLRAIRAGGEPTDGEDAFSWETLRLTQYTNPKGERFQGLNHQEQAIAKAWACALITRFDRCSDRKGVVRLADVISVYLPKQLPDLARLLHWLLLNMTVPEEFRPVNSACAIVQRRLGEFTPSADAP